MFTLQKTVRFEASHQLLYHDGKCARLHGHSWKATLVVQGAHLQGAGPKQGMLVDYSDLSVAVKPLVDDFLDHHHLNDTLQTDSPTSEFIARWLYEKLKPAVPLLTAVVVEETCTSSCRYEP